MSPPIRILAGSHAQISASSSDLPSATRTSTSKPKTPIGAIAGGKPSVHNHFPVASTKPAIFLLGVVGGAVLLFLVGFALLLFCKRRGLKIPKIRKASGPKSLFDSEERRPNLESEEAVAVNRPLLYVRGTLLLCPKLLTWVGPFSGSYEPCDVLAG